MREFALYNPTDFGMYGAPAGDEAYAILRDLNTDKAYLTYIITEDMDAPPIIDIDSMDPALVCGTGTKVDNGLWNGDYYTFLDKIFESKKIVSADFVEYNELLDDESKTTATWCMEALHYLSLKIKEL